MYIERFVPYEKNLIPSDLKPLVQNLPFDLKAEVLVTDLLKKNKKEIRLNVIFSDFFHRRFGKDIADIKHDEGSRISSFYIFLSRLSLYDVFPEILAHKQNEKFYSGKIMVENYRQRKEEERYARKFFAPLENEFFFHKVDIEREEAGIFESINNSDLSGLVGSIWDIDPDLPLEMATGIIKIIPFIHNTSGNIEIILSLLKKLINEDISLKTDFVTIQNNETNLSKRLGVDFALQLSDKTFLKKFIFVIENLKNPETFTDYLPNGKIRKVIDLFLSYTLPVESGYDIIINLAEPQRSFILDDKSYSARLGASTLI